MSDKIVCVTDLGYVGLPLALASPWHPGVIGFDVDLARSPIEAMDQYVPPAPVLMMIGEDGGRLICHTPHQNVSPPTSHS